MKLRCTVALHACLWLAALCPAPSRADDPPRQTLRLVAIATCTQMDCDGGSCCNACGFSGWRENKSGLEAIAARGTARLPTCIVNGCGKCAIEVKATGHRRGEQFIVTNWSKVPATRSQ